jgi:hypothetical protein
VSNALRRVAPWIRCIPCPVILIAGIVGIFLMFGWISLVASKVFTGSGLGHCCIIGGVHFNYMGAFVLVCGVVAALVIAGVLQFRDWLRWRNLERRYGVKSSELERSARRTRGSRSNDAGDLADTDDGA